MAPFRMPFTTRRGPTTTGLEPSNDENARPGSNGAPLAMGPRTGKESVVLALKSPRDEPSEYKMSCQLCKRPQDQLAAPLAFVGHADIFESGQ